MECGGTVKTSGSTRKTRNLLSTRKTTRRPVIYQEDWKFTRKTGKSPGINQEDQEVTRNLPGRPGSHQESTRKTRNSPGILAILQGRLGIHQDSTRNSGNPTRKTGTTGIPVGIRGAVESSAEHDSWAYVTEVHAPERVADFYQRNPSAPRQIQATVFSKIPFRPMSPIYFEAKQP